MSIYEDFKSSDAVDEKLVHGLIGPEKQENFILLTARLMIKNGGGAYDTERRMRACIEKMKLSHMQISILPNMMFSTQHDMTLMKTSTTWNMANLQDLIHMTEYFMRDKWTFDECCKELLRIYQKKLVIPEWAMFYLIFPLSSALTAVVMFGSSWLTMPFAALYAFPIGAITHYQRHKNPPAFVLEFLSCVVVGFLSIITSYYVQGLCFQSLAFSAIVWLLPGLSITIGIIELGTNNLVSGTARVISSLLVAAILAYGLVLGSEIAAWLPSTAVSQQCPSIGSNNILVLFLAPFTVACFALMLGIDPKELPVPVLIGWIGWFVTRGMSVTATITNNFVTSIVISTLASAWAEFRIGSGIPTLFTGLEILVPGSISIKELLGAELGQSGTNFGAIILQVTIGLFLGINLSFWIVPKLIRMFKIALGKHSGKKEIGDMELGTEIRYAGGAFGSPDGEVTSPRIETGNDVSNNVKVNEA